jgi:hypothetical protein
MLALCEEEHRNVQQNPEITPDLPRLFALTSSSSFKFR